jgi:hypothetical protein
VHFKILTNNYGVVKQYLISNSYNVGIADSLPVTPAKATGNIILVVAQVTPDDLRRGSGRVPPALFVSGSPSATDKKKCPPRDKGG